MEALRDLLNFVDKAYNDTTTMFAGLKPRNGSEAVLRLLEEGLTAEALKRKEKRKEWGVE